MPSSKEAAAAKDADGNLQPTIYYVTIHVYEQD